jgi:predicted metal-dependent hydrolase
MEQMVIANIDIEVVRKNIKNIHLAVYPPDGKVRLALPGSVSDETARMFTISKLSWIRRQQRMFQEQHREPERKYIDRETHYFFGRRYLLKIVETEKLAHVRIQNKKYLELHIHTRSSLAQRRHVLTEWYRAELKKAVPELLSRWEKRIGESVDDWGVRQMKTKWGTCNIEARRIWLNLELAKKPLRCVEYIIVHELVHLLERRHTDRFRMLMDRHMPSWKSCREELNKMPVSRPGWVY